MSLSRLRARFTGAVGRLFDDCCLCQAPVGDEEPASPSVSGTSATLDEPAWRDGARRPPVCNGCLSWFPAARASAADDLCLACGSLRDVFDQAGEHCHRCVGTPTPLDRIVVPYRYQWPVDRLIGQLKYHEKRHLAPLFGGLLAREVHRIDAAAKVRGGVLTNRSAVLLPVPLHPSRLAGRGFNQAADIAHWCALALGQDCKPGWACRIEDTGSLASAGRAERELAIRGAFAVDAAVSGRSVVIVDDVLTTGATTAELARECLDTGAATVELWAVARTVARPEDGASRCLS